MLELTVLPPGREKDGSTNGELLRGATDGYKRANVETVHAQTVDGGGCRSCGSVVGWGVERRKMLEAAWLHKLVALWRRWLVLLRSALLVRRLMAPSWPRGRSRTEVEELAAKVHVNTGADLSAFAKAAHIGRADPNVAFTDGSVKNGKPPAAEIRALHSLYLLSVLRCSVLPLSIEHFGV